MISKDDNREVSNKKFWEKVAKFYTPIQERKNAKLYIELCARISQYLKPDMQVLELACGTGQLTIPLCQKVAVWEATDFSEQMIKEATARVTNLPVSFSVQDATDLPYEDGRFDAVIIANALHIMPDPQKALVEIQRILKNGGLLIAPTFVYDGKINKFRIFIMERLGFRTFHKWTSREYAEFVCKQGFQKIDCGTITGEMLPECILICSR